MKISVNYPQLMHQYLSMFQFYPDSYSFGNAFRKLNIKVFAVYLVAEGMCTVAAMTLLCHSVSEIEYNTKDRVH